jgi:hypothetical protein
MLISIRRRPKNDSMLWYTLQSIHLYLLISFTIDNLELLFFLKEHTETDDSAIDEEAADNTHYHGGNRNDVGVC